jgi:hypothetical protein
MRKKTFLTWSVALIFLILMFQNAYGAIYMRQKHHTDAVTIMGNTQPAHDLIVESWITSNKIAVMDKEQKTIMDIDKKIITMVNHGEKTIAVMPMDLSESMDKQTGDMSQEEKAEFQQFMGKMMQFDIQVEETNDRKKLVGGIVENTFKR